jgi:hypothetical protein
LRGSRRGLESTFRFHELTIVVLGIDVRERLDVDPDGFALVPADDLARADVPREGLELGKQGPAEENRVRRNCSMDGDDEVAARAEGRRDPPDAVRRDGDGYRLGIPGDAVDSVRLAGLAAVAGVGFERDPATAARQASEALELGAGLVAAGEDDGALADVRRNAALDLRTARVALARVVLAVASVALAASTIPTITV